MNEKHREVRAWLETKFGGDPIPPYEINHKTIDLLYELMQKNVKKDRDTQLIIEDMRQMGEEYAAEAQREGRILEQLGLTSASLSQSGVTSLRTLASVASTLKIRNTTDSNYLLALHELGEELFKVSEARQLEQRAASQFLQQTKSSMIKSDKLKQALSELETQATHQSQEMKSHSKHASFLQTKAKEYRATLQQYQDQLSKTGVDPSLYHQELVRQYQELNALKEEMIPLKTKLQTYHSLPPDITLTKVKIEEMKQQLDKLETELTKRINIMHM